MKFLNNIAGDSTFSGAHFVLYSSANSGLNATNVQDAIDNLNAIVATGSLSTPQGTWLISGGGVAWVTGYTFDVAPSQYYIAGIAHTAPATTVTMASPDATFNRFDAIVVNTTGTVSIIQGTPSATPALPTVDPQTYLVLTFIRVDTGTIQPPVITSILVYDENAGTPTEWAGTTNQSGQIVFASTTNPHTGTKDTEGTNVANGTFFQYQASSTTDVTLKTNLVFYVRSKGAFSKKSIVVSFLNGTTQVGSTVTLSDGFFGFTSSNTTTYQTIVIPVTQFNITSGTLANTVKFLISGAGSSIAGFYFDTCSLQGGTGGGTSSGITLAQGDARYLKQAANLSDLTSVSTARTNLGLGTAATHASTDFALSSTTVNGHTLTSNVTVTASDVGLGNVLNTSTANTLAGYNNSGAFSDVTVSTGLSLSGGVLTATGGGGSGTVTSIDVSGGTTGLTTSGGPITTSGTITLAGTLNVNSGGTGATTQTNHGIMIGHGTISAVTATAAMTDGQLLVGQTSADPLPKTLSGSGATFTLSSAGVLTVSGIANGSLSNSSITIGGTSTALGGSVLGNVTNDTQTKASIVPNTAPSAGQILVGNAGGTAYAPVSMSSDATLASTGAITLANTAVTATSYGDASHVGTFTVDSKGRLTAASNVSIAISSSAVSGLATIATSGAITDATGTLLVSHGGTGLATLTSHALQVGNGTSAITQLGLGTTTTVLHGNASGDPSFSAVVLTTDVSGTLPVGNGGTGLATLTSHALYVGNTTSAPTALGLGTSGQILTSNGASSDPSFQTLVTAPPSGANLYLFGSCV